MITVLNVIIVAEVANKSNLNKNDAKNAVNATIDAIKKNVNKGVTPIGFDTFKVVKRKARTGINPQTGEKIMIKAKNVVKFKAGKLIFSKRATGHFPDNNEMIQKLKSI